MIFIGEIPTGKKEEAAREAWGLWGCNAVCEGDRGKESRIKRVSHCHTVPGESWPNDWVSLNKNLMIEDFYIW